MLLVRELRAALAGYPDHWEVRVHQDGLPHLCKACAELVYTQFCEDCEELLVYGWSSVEAVRHDHLDVGGNVVAIVIAEE